MMSSIISIFLIALALLNYCEGDIISAPRLCANSECSVPISEAKCLIGYTSGRKETISCKPTDKITVYSKSVEGKESLWGVEVNGKKGTIPKNVIRETTVYLADDKLNPVPSKFPENPESEKRNIEEPKVSENEAMTPGTSGEISTTPESYKVIEGTTITPTTPDSYKVIEGTTIIPDSSVMATPTLSSVGDDFISSNTPSEVPHISSTTTMAKTEMTESITNTASESENSKLMNPMMTFKSDFVTGKNEVSKRDIEHYSEIPGSEEILTPNKVNSTPTDGHEVLDKDVKIGQESHVNEESERLRNVNGDEDNTGEGEEDGDDIEEENDDDFEEENDDGENDEEEDDDGENDDEDVDEENDEGDRENDEEGSKNTNEKIGEARNEVNAHKEHEADLLDKEQNTSVYHDEKTAELVKSQVPESHSNAVASKSYDGTSEMHAVNNTSDISVTTGETQLENSNETEVASHVSSPSSESYVEGDTATRSHSGDSSTAALVNTLGSAPTLTSPNTLNMPNRETHPAIMKENAVQFNSAEEQNYKSSDSVSSDTESADDITSQNGILENTTGSIESSIEHSEKMDLAAVEHHDQGKEIVSQNNMQRNDESSKMEETDILKDSEEIHTGDTITTPSPFLQQEENTFLPTSGDGELKTDVNEESVTSTEVPPVEHMTDSPYKEMVQDEDIKITHPFYEAGQERITADIENNQMEPKEPDQEKKNIAETLNVFGSDSNLSTSEESSGIFSMIFSPFSSGYGYMMDMVFGTSDEIEMITESESIMVGIPDKTETISKQPGDQENEMDIGGGCSNDHCEANPTDSYFKMLSSDLPSGSEASDKDQELNSWIDIARENYHNPFDINNPSYYRALLFSISVGAVLGCCFLGHYYIEGKKRDVFLLAKLNVVEKKLMVSSTECLILKDKLKNADDSTEIIESLKSDLERIQNENLAQELSAAEQRVLELSNELKKVQTELIQKEDEHNEQYDELRKLYDNQKKQYEEDLRNKTVEAVMALTKCKSLEVTLTETKDALTVKENEIAVLQECLEKLKILNGEEPGKAAIQFQDMLDFGKLKAELTSVSKERDRLKDELQGEEEARKLLEDHVKVIEEEVEKLRKCHEAAEKDKTEAQTRLEVLSSYFKEKENQLQKELGAQIQKYTDASSVMQHMKSLEEEVENYRKELNQSTPQTVEQIGEEPMQEIIDANPENEGSQNETLKKEILDQERGYKSQLSTIEKKARENWVAARQAERKLDESKQEASQLRNRLTMLSKSNAQSVSQNGDDSKQNISVMDSNGEMSASPLNLGLASNSSLDSFFLDPNSSPPLVSGGGRLPPLLPPPPFPPLPTLPPRSPYHHPLSPPLPFVPPPPPEDVLYPPSVDGHRPPPLGRMSSPPPPPSPSHSPRLPHTNSRPGKYPSPFHDHKGRRRSASPPSDMYRGMPIDDRGLTDEGWGMGRYCTPPPHSTHLPDYPPFLYPHSRPHWEEETMPQKSSMKSTPTQAEAPKEKKGGKSKENHPTESEKLDKTNRHGGKQ